MSGRSDLGPAIIGAITGLVLAVFLKWLGLIIGGMVAGYLSCRRPDEAWIVGFKSAGIIVGFILLFLLFFAPAIPFFVVVLGVGLVMSIILMIVIGVLFALGAVLGAYIGRNRPECAGSGEQYMYGGVPTYG